MAQLQPTAFIDDAALAAREIEFLPRTCFRGGANLAGSNACGIGIGIDAGRVVGTPAQFTLLDQFGNARNAQISQHIGGLGYSEKGTSSGTSGTLPDAVIRTGPSESDGDITFGGNAALITLAAGWVEGG